MNIPSLVICADAESLAIRAAEFIVECAREAVQEHGSFVVALSGGATPEQTYALLAQADRRAAMPWSKTHVFFGDERFVPHSDTRSNYAMAHRSMLAHAPLRPSQVSPVPVQSPSAADAATAYARCLAEFFSIHSGDPPPRFDLILLGVGEDGHTASLFPGSPALNVADAWVTWTSPGGAVSSVDRVTLTYPVINAARHVAFLVAGEKKAPVLRDILEGQVTRERCPAAGVRPVNGTLTWFIDKAAARLLTRDHGST